MKVNAQDLTTRRAGVPGRSSTGHAATCVIWILAGLLSLPVHAAEMIMEEDGEPPTSEQPGSAAAPAQDGQESAAAEPTTESPVTGAQPSPDENGPPTEPVLLPVTDTVNDELTTTRETPALAPVEPSPPAAVAVEPPTGNATDATRGETPAAPAPAGSTADPPVGTAEPILAPADYAGPRQPFEVLGKTINPGQHRRLDWNPTGYAGLNLRTPVQVVHGKHHGPVLCLTAALHGDEVNGVEIVRRVVHPLDPLKLRGTVIAVPIVNLQGFLRNSRYLPDRRDLNRNFPGSPRGSSARRIAHSLFTGVIRHCHALVDLHTGSFHRSNLPQLRADLHDPAVVELTRGFGSMAVLHVPAARGTLRGAAQRAGIPAVTLEAGAPLHLHVESVESGVEAVRELLNHLEMVPRFRLWNDAQPLYYRSTWVRPEQGGILFSRVKLGDKVSRGDVLGTVTDPVRNVRQKIRAPVDGRILGMALNQMVMPGFAAFHLGINEGSQLRPVAIPPAEDDDAVTVEELEEAGDDPSE